MSVTMLPNGRVIHKIRVTPRGARMATVSCIKCGEHFEIRERMAARQARCDECKEWKIPGSPSGYHVATAELAPILEEKIREIDDRLRFESGLHNEKITTFGAVEQISKDAASTLKCNQDAVIRRLYAIRVRESRVVNTEVADALLLACGLFIEDLPLRTFPGSLTHAREMVEIEAENAGLELTPEELDRAARARLKKATEEVLALDGDSDSLAA